MLHLLDISYSIYHSSFQYVLFDQSFSHSIISYSSNHPFYSRYPICDLSFILSKNPIRSIIYSLNISYSINSSCTLLLYNSFIFQSLMVGHLQPLTHLFIYYNKDICKITYLPIHSLTHLLNHLFTL